MGSANGAAELEKIMKSLGAFGMYSVNEALFLMDDFGNMVKVPQVGLEHALTELFDAADSKILGVAA
jgi:hypothetical protein